MVAISNNFILVSLKYASVTNNLSFYIEYLIFILMGRKISMSLSIFKLLDSS